jgi:gluconokinase
MSVGQMVFEDALEVGSLMIPTDPKPEAVFPIVLGLDIGTSGARAGLFDGRGNEIAGSMICFSDKVYQPLRSGVDVDADQLFSETVQVIDRLLQREDTESTRIDIVAVSCFWHSLLGVGSDGSAVTPLYGWADLRSAAAAERLRSQCDETEVHQRTGCRFHPSYWPAKLSWLRSEQAELFKTVRTWMSFSEYFQQRLIGEMTCSVSMASGSGLLNQRDCEWDSELLGILDLSAGQLPAIAGPRQTLTKLKDENRELGWERLNNARWFPAIGDGAASNIGAGCVTAESALLMIGTSGAMRIIYEGEPPAKIPPELWSYRVDHQRVVVGGALSDGGGLYRWMRETLAVLSDDEGTERALAAMDADSHGLTVLPFWSGERSTGWNASARGAILGLSSSTEPIDIVRASMEGIAYRFALIAEALESLAPQAAIVAAGNALLASPCWTQIVSDVLGQPVRLSTAAEASLRGAVLLALSGTDRIELAGIPAAGDRIFEPDMSRHEKYRAARERQQQAYKKLYA